MDIFDTNVLVGIVRNLKLAPTFLLDRFFPLVTEADEEFLSIDVDVGKRRLSPFVAPTVAGKIVEARRITTNTFKPAYVKDKRAPDFRRPVRRMLGERIGGGLTPAERMQANLEFELADQIDMLNRRLVWMAASALQTGTITVTGDGFPTTVIDFQRNAALSPSLAGGAQWTPANVAAGTATPSENVDTWSALVLQHSGAVVTDIVFTLTPWQGFISDDKVQKSIWYPRSGDSTVDMGGGIKSGAQYKGRWGGYDLWLYNDWYVDPADDTEKPMLTDGNVVLASQDMQGSRAFGAIMDPDFAYGAMAYAPKSWTEKDPAQRMLLMQSAPLVIPQRVNAAACATVT